MTTDRVYFDDGFFRFFEELAENNHKEWFHANKSRFEQHVRQPLTDLVFDLISTMNQEGESLDIEAKDCLLRPNRDTRFSKDKSPYNLNCTAFVSRGGRKDKTIPGLFLRAAPYALGVMGGCYQPSTLQLASIRNAIAANLEEFSAALSAQDFVEVFGELQGDKAKRLPEPWKAFIDHQPLIANRQFYYAKSLPADVITKSGLVEVLMSHWRSGKPLNDFLSDALKGGS